MGGGHLPKYIRHIPEYTLALILSNRLPLCLPEDLVLHTKVMQHLFLLNLIP